MSAGRRNITQSRNSRIPVPVRNPSCVMPRKSVARDAKNAPGDGGEESWGEWVRGADGERATAGVLDAREWYAGGRVLLEFSQRARFDDRAARHQLLPEGHILRGPVRLRQDEEQRVI